MGVQKEALALLGLEGLQEMTKAVILFFLAHGKSIQFSS